MKALHDYLTQLDDNGVSYCLAVYCSDGTLFQANAEVVSHDTAHVVLAAHNKAADWLFVPTTQGYCFQVSET